MKKLLIILISIFMLSCNKDETTTVTDQTALRLVTGINFRENVDDIPVKLGNPNVLVNNKFLIYPNPALQKPVFFAEENITNIWFVAANPEKIHQSVNFSDILNSNMYTEQSIISNANFSISEQSLSNINVNIETLEIGYYKVFVKIGGEIYWDNFYKCGSDFNKEKYLALASFWN